MIVPLDTQFHTQLDDLVKTLEMLLNQHNNISTASQSLLMPVECVSVNTDDSSSANYEMNKFYAARFGNQQMIDYVLDRSLLSW